MSAEAFNHLATIGSTETIALAVDEIFATPAATNTPSVALAPAPSAVGPDATR